MLKRSSLVVLTAAMAALSVLFVMGAIVGSRIQAESMTLPANNASVNTGDAADEGDQIRWTGSAGTADTASKSVTLAQSVDQIQLRARESGSSANDDDLSIYVDGTSAGNKVGQVHPPSGSAFATLTANLSSSISAGTHTIYIGPSQTNDSFVALDWFETWSTGAGADTTAPNTTIDSGPVEGSTTADGNVSFGFSGTDNVTSSGSLTFECSIDGLSYVSCTSPKSYSLAPGNHTFAVKATDAALNTDASPASRNFTVPSAGGDTTAPTTSLTNITSPTNDSSPTFSFSGSDNVGVAGFECQMDSLGWEACTSPHTTDVLLDGSHTFQVRAVDAAGNFDQIPESQTFTVDASAPSSPTITSGPENGSTDADGSFSYAFTGESGGTFQCSLDQGTASYSTCTSPKSYTSQPEGNYTFRVRQTDALGNVGDPALRTVTVSTGGGGQAFSTKVQAETFTESSSLIDNVDGSNDEGTHLEYQAGALTTDRAQKSETFVGPVTSIDLRVQSNTGVEDLAVYVDGTASGNKVATISDISSTFETRSANVNIASGAHTIYVAPDNTVSSPRIRFDWIQYNGTTGGGGTTDNTDPTTTLNNIVTPTNDTRPTFTFTGTDNVGVSGFECRLDNAATWSACASPYTTPLLSEGTHLFEVRAKDAAGNVTQTPASQEFVVDSTAPAAPSITGGPADASTDTDGDISYTFSGETGATFETSLDQGTANYVSSTSPKVYDNLSNGTYTFRVRQTDEAGNTSAVTTRTVTIAVPATGLDLPQTLQAETFHWTSASITENDGTADVGSSLMWGGGATTSAVADQAINFNQAVATLDVRARGSATTEDLAVYLDGTASGNKIASQQNLALGFTTYTFSVSIPSGAHTIYVGPDSTLSSTGRLRVDQLEFKAAGVDNTAPNTNVTPINSPTNDNTPTFSFSSPDSDATGFECKVDAGSFAPCTSPYTASTLTEGLHTFSVRAKDAVPNYDPTPATQTFTVDTAAPSAPSITSPASDGTTDTDGNVSFSFTGESNATFQCSFSTGADNFSNCTSPRSYTSQPNGSYTFKVKQTDQAGNVSTVASRTITINVQGGQIGSVPISGLGTVSTANHNSIPVDDSGNAVDLNDCNHRIARGTTTSSTVTGSGTVASPWVGRDAWKNLESAIGPGEIICIDGPNGFSGNGIYDVNGGITGNGINDAGEYKINVDASGTSASNRTYIMSTPGTGRAEFVGQLELRGDNQYLYGMKMDCSGGTTENSVSNQGRLSVARGIGMLGANDYIVNNELYCSRQTDPAEDALPGVPNVANVIKVGGSAPAPSPTILGNWIHNTGAPHVLYDAGNESVPSANVNWTGSNDNKGIYYDSGPGGYVAQNLFHDTAEQSMSIYNATSGAVTVENNIFGRNGDANLSMDDSGATATIRNNVSTHNLNGKNWTHRSGSGSVTNNCFFLPGGGSGADTALQGAGNITADPQYAHTPGPDTLAGWYDNNDDYTIGNSTCAAKLGVTQTKSPNR